MFVVSGCPRSGTSLTMLILSKLFGEDRILGGKFGFQDDPVQEEGEEDHHFELRKYFFDLNKEREEKAGRSREKTMDMNPNGFWECQYTVAGINYSYGMRTMLKGFLEETDENRTCVKIVSQGLLNSDPRYITKILYLLRHPRAVAKSQERLIRGVAFDNKDFSELAKIHTPEMFIKVTQMAALFLKDHPDIEVKILEYDDLIEHPKDNIKSICDFFKIDFEDRWPLVKDAVKPKYRRSYPQEIELDLWKDAETLYDLMKEKKYEEILEYSKDPQKPMNRSTRKWTCQRSGNTVDEKICKMCKEDRMFREEGKRAAIARKIEWEDKPCLFEVGFDMDAKEYKTVRESILTNFWIDDDSRENYRKAMDAFELQ